MYFKITFKRLSKKYFLDFLFFSMARHWPQALAFKSEFTQNIIMGIYWIIANQKDTYEHCVYSSRDGKKYILEKQKISILHI